MSQELNITIQNHFAELTDPRRKESTYPLINIVIMSVCAVICGADDFVAINTFAKKRKDWFAKFLDLSNGIPSHDRFNYILARIKPEEFEKCLLSWITSLHDVTRGRVIPIDGKTLRGSYDNKRSKAAIHMVSAWASANHISLGQVVTDEQSNEITAIPKLLEMIELSGSLVTIDAMGCQTAIAEKIIEEGADYCLAVKGNQPTLHQGIVDFFSPIFEDILADETLPYHFSHETTHGRDVQRHSMICPVPKNLADRERWKHLKAIGAVVSISNRNGKESSEIRYYILSRLMSAEEFAQSVRTHWAVENNLHWQLDVTFREDECRIRNGHADANFSILRRTALSLLKHESTAKVGIKNKRLSAGWDEDYLMKVLCGQ